MPDSKPSTSEKGPLEIRPVFAPFLGTGVLNSLLMSFALAFFFLICVGDMGLIFILMVLFMAFVTLSALGIANTFFSYSKTSYSIGEDHVTFRGGGLGMNKEIEIEYGKITQVTLRQPFWEKALYGTGTLSIDGAGTSGFGVSFRHIKDSDQVCEILESRMRAKAFSLLRKRVIRQERPSLLASIAALIPVIIKVLGITSFFGVFVGLILALNIGSESPQHFIDLMSGQVEQIIDVGAETMPVDQARRSALVVLGLLAISYAIMGTSMIIRVFFARRSIYTLYDDVIEYKRRTLGRMQKFIPIENVTDVTFTQSFLQRLFDIANVRISCQGATGTISFSSMPGGPDFVSNLQRLMEGHEIESIEDETELAPEQGLDEGRAPDADVLELRMSMGRSVTAYLVKTAFNTLKELLILGTLALGVVYFVTYFFSEEIENIEVAYPWIAGGIGVLVGLSLLVQLSRVPRLISRARRTRYSIGPQNIQSSYALFSKEDTRFATAKITAVIVRRGLWDRIFRTATIDFRSIGSTAPLSFFHIPLAELDLQGIASYLAFSQDEVQQRIVARFTPLRWALRRGWYLPRFILVALLLALPIGFVGMIPPLLFIIPVLIVVLGPISDFLTQWAHHSRGELEFHSDHLVLSRGLLRTHVFMSGYAHLKHVRSTTYPLGDWGQVTLYGSTGARATIPYINNPRGTHDFVDTLMSIGRLPPAAGADSLDTAVIAEYRPAFNHAITNMIGVLIISVLVCPLLILLPFALARAIMQTRRTTYMLETRRVTVLSGILWRRQGTVLLNRIDNVTTSEGFFNKTFKNGNIAISTAGSSSADLVLFALEDHLTVAQRIQGRLSGEDSFRPEQSSYHRE